MNLEDKIKKSRTTILKRFSQIQPTIMIRSSEEQQCN